MIDDFDAYDEEAPEGDSPASEADALDHLWNAAHEMLSAMRTVLDAADEFVASQRGARPTGRADHDAAESREGRVRHIDIDVRADDDGRSDESRSDAGTGAK